MKNKIFIVALSLFSIININAQENQTLGNDSKSENKLYVKGNALLIPIGVINAGLEYQLNNKFTLQGDVLISPWKSFAGHELQYYSLSVEGRYYFKEAFKGWFLGANMGASSFVLQKWSYWNDDPYPSKREENVIFTKSNLYQKGYSFLVGVTAGYQFRLADNWNMELYGTLGSSQDFYKGYDRVSGKRYDEAKNYNRSGEIIPYRGGVMISYRLK
ncbi:DUF3575 domain-containing protein [Chryseobacterium sp. PBS4-4]|uniref:DUF3575 domain-containing protein n=1 Tax=Chryseobacterium edaphi TaxID=2976532 RepID=A0ABT2W0S4_9FLAO|nr:DUF3575 domain-containing protein [Chryseobacterium edaphi]MCU7615585.1 DUF3575 domain-containing protein [Chryseobacterium edaphi]